MLRRSPLRTVRARCPSTWLKQALMARGRMQVLACVCDVVLSSSRQELRRRRTTCLDHLVPDDLGPGELGEVAAAVAVAEAPMVSPGPVEHAEVAGGDPVLRLVRVCAGCPLVDELPHVGVQGPEAAGWPGWTGPYWSVSWGRRSSASPGPCCTACSAQLGHSRHRRGTWSGTRHGAPAPAESRSERGTAVFCCSPRRGLRRRLQARSHRAP